MQPQIRRRFAIVLAVFAVLLIATMAGLIIFTNTNYGRERVRQFTQDIVQGAAKRGIVRIGKIEGNLLTGFQILDVSITDSAGAPFLVADTARANYGLIPLLRKQVILTDVKLVHPLIVLSQDDSAQWNFRTIFTRAVKKPRTDSSMRYGDWLEFKDVELVGGRLALRALWKPKATLTGAARDSAIAQMLSGQSDSRVYVVREGDSYRKVSEFRDITGKFPRIRLKHPDTRVRRVEVAQASMYAMPFRPPGIQVREITGALEFTSDSLWWNDVRANLPGSNLAASGWYSDDLKGLRVDVRASPISLADARWVYPHLPAEGTGTLNLLVRWTDTTETYIARQADIRVGTAHLAGDFAITMFENGDTLRFHDTDVRVADLDMRLIEQVFPDLKIPIRGTVSGTSKLDGGVGAMRIDSDVTLDVPGTGRGHFLAVGEIGYDVDHRALRARALRVRADRVPVRLAEMFVDGVPVGGTIQGTATIDGTTASTLRGTFDLTHVESARRSRATGNAAIRTGPRPWIDVDARLLPLSLAEVGTLAPAAGLRGDASGPVRLTGTLGDLKVRGDLAVAGGGSIIVRGALDLASREKGYDLDLQATLFNANAVTTRAPRTALTASAFARGRGFDPATMQGAFGANLAGSTIDTLALDTAHVRVAIAKGLARVDSLMLRGTGTTARGNGTLGLVAGVDGTLRYVVQVDSLQALNRYLPAPDTGRVQPRPRVLAERVARARRDSAFIAARTEVARAALRRPPPRTIPVDTPQTVRRDSLAGTVYAAGTVRGNITQLDARGRLTATNVVALGNTVRRARVEYGVTKSSGQGPTVAIGADMDSVWAAGFALDSLNVRLGYSSPNGKLAILVVQDSSRTYALGGDFALHSDHREVHLRDASLRFDSTTWKSTRQSTVRWGGGRIEVDQFELKNGTTGRIFVDGRIPTDAPGHIDVVVDNFEVGDVAALLQSDLPARGLVSLRATVEGPTSAPRMRGALGVLGASYKGQTVADTKVSFQYENARLDAEMEATRRGGGRILTGSARVPINLALGTSEPRLPGGPLEIDINADNLPLELIPAFTDAVTGVSGTAAGIVRVRGTTSRPVVAGGLAVVGGRARVEATGVAFHDVTAAVRLARDTVVIDSIVGYNGGRVLLRGGIGIARITEPRFDLYLVANNARVLDNERGLVRADAGLALSGPFNRAYVSGRIGIRHGVIYLPEPDGKKVIGSDDPSLFTVLDTALIRDSDLLPTQSPLLANLRMDVSVDVARDTWVRTRDANVEIFTQPDEQLMVRVNRRRQAFTLEGSVSTDRGDYTFLSKRFQIRQGTATFIGTQEFNPTLQITGEYEVQTEDREPLSIRVAIGGTAMSPRLSLESDARPPIPQSDLLSFLAFGRSSSSLLQLGGSSLSGGSGTTVGGIAGAGATLIGQRLAAVALDAFVNDFEGQASRQFGADVFNITPADISPELARSGQLAAFFKGTEIEAGKYTDPRTFVAIQARPAMFASSRQDRAAPGFRVTRRVGKGYRIEASVEPRFLLRAPTLEPNKTASPTSVFGAFLIREWRF
jgi:translocation and assembly module TamB